MGANGNGNKNVVVLQLSGGNDALNTVIPYADQNYYDNRQYLGIPENEVLHLDDKLGLNPAMGPIKSLWDEGKVAVINGIGYPSPNRSHFRSMDVWHTAEPNDIAPEGWLGQAVRDLDPKGENVVTGVNFGRGLPRAMYAKDVPVASVGNLDTYGLMPDIKDERARAIALEAFSQIYGGSGKDTISQFISQVGMDALKGADILRTAPAAYSSSIEYADNPIAENMKNIAQVMFADVGTRIFYTQHGSFDTHANELASHAKLWNEVSTAVADFMDDLKEHGKDKDTVVLMFSEFGRRIRDNGAGTDHGSGGVAFVIGGDVNGGLYGDFPSLRDEDQLEGDMHFNNDFRLTYSTILDRWLGLDPVSITNGNFEQFDFVSK
ncbi:MAG: DUF1501 domain-containing protein [Dehalococcoidia bacterium]|nr:DUF1501 domain-containing protein [Dehalococcoidia bacterium]